MNSRIFKSVLLFFSDINECGLDNGGCEGECTNLVGAFSCSCGEGLQLSPDLRGCDGKRQLRSMIEPFS